MLKLLGALHELAAQRGDGLRPEFVKAISEAAASLDAGELTNGADRVQPGADQTAPPKLRVVEGAPRNR